MKAISILFFVLPIAFSCNSESAQKASSSNANSLKDAYKDNFYIGAALGAEHIREEDPIASGLVSKEFNSLTAENIMKWMYIHPERGKFNFELPDKFVALGEKHGMQLIGHTLIWHSQTAPWVNNIKTGGEMEKVMEEHISSIVGHFKGKIHGWDVLNEVLNEDGTLRESIFLKTMGESYIKKAFDLAAAADPEAELYYNDYNIEQPRKREGCIKMIKKLQESGTKIDGVGIQGHWGLNGPPVEEIEKSIIEYAALGLKVMFTEVDINVLPNPWDLTGADVSLNYPGSPHMNPYPEGLPDSIAIKQAKRYKDIFKVLIKHQDKIDRVTFWGVNDGHSWKNNWPIKGRTDYPLLFDREFKPKKAYYSVMELKNPDIKP